MQRALVAMLRTLRDPLWRFKFEEFKRLVQAAGYTIVAEVIQVKDKPKSATLFGRGKIEEMKKIIEERSVDVVLVYNVLRSIQKLNLELAFRKPVYDRYELTLEIFERNASDKVSKLQIELARVQKEIPYARLMVNLRFRGDRVYFGAGGEYAWKVRVAELRRRMKMLREEIEKRKEEKVRQIEERKANGFKIACIVGYYNAGKTSLFNALTGESKPVSDMPFTTLSSKYSRIKGAERILLVDTIGFVIDLDPQIIASFDLNIEDMRHSDALILVLDLSDPLEWFRIKARTALQILKERKVLDEKPLIVALNKADLVSSISEIEDKKRLAYEEVITVTSREAPIVVVSAKTGVGLGSLVETLVRILGETEQRAEISSGRDVGETSKMAKNGRV